MAPLFIFQMELPLHTKLATYAIELRRDGWVFQPFKISMLVDECEHGSIYSQYETLNLGFREFFRDIEKIRSDFEIKTRN